VPCNFSKDKDDAMYAKSNFHFTRADTIRMSVLAEARVLLSRFSRIAQIGEKPWIIQSRG
jgi:hypothetical protein